MCKQFCEKNGQRFGGILGLDEPAMDLSLYERCASVIRCMCNFARYRLCMSLITHKRLL